MKSKSLNTADKKNIACLLAGVIFFITDQFLKNLALSSYRYQTHELIPHLLSFNFTPNYNISFSLPLGGNYLSLIITAIIFIIIGLISSKLSNRLEKIGLIIITLGAISNLIDRLRYGYVIDYFDLRWFTVFNLADVLISLGTLYLIVITLKKSR